MCINESCKNPPFLKPSSSLNPSAQEWRPNQLHLIHPLHPAPAPPPLPPHTAAQVVALAPHPSQKLLWHLPHQQLMPFHHSYTPYVPSACSHMVYHPTTLPSSANGRLCAAAAQPHFDGENKDSGRLEEKGLENYCANKMESTPIFKGRSKRVSKMWRPPPLPQREWRPRETGGGAASSPRGVSPLKGLSSSSSRTTVMVKNIPNQLRRDFMLKFLDSYCSAYSLEYDFMYLPMDFRRKDNLGYAFVNFENGGDALKFKDILHNYKWGTIETNKGLYTSKKICAITWATIQGKERLVQRFEDSIFPCDNLEFLPVVFDPPRGGSNTTPPVVVGRVSRQICKGAR